MDPHNVAAQQGTSEGDLARQQRIDLCYGPLLNVLRWLIDPSSTSAHGATVPLEGLSDEQRGVLKSRLLKVCVLEVGVMCVGVLCVRPGGFFAVCMTMCLFNS